MNPANWIGCSRFSLDVCVLRTVPGTCVGIDKCDSGFLRGGKFWMDSVCGGVVRWQLKPQTLISSTDCVYRGATPRNFVYYSSNFELSSRCFRFATTHSSQHGDLFNTCIVRFVTSCHFDILSIINWYRYHKFCFSFILYHFRILVGDLRKVLWYSFPGG